MPALYRKIILICLLLSVSSYGFGSHIYGGELSMVYLGKTGFYRFGYTQYIEGSNAAAQTQRLRIFQKNGLKLIQQVVVNYRNETLVTIPSSPCARLQTFKLKQITYSADVQLDLTKYTDTDGYIVEISFSGVTNVGNVVSSATLGISCTLVFSALSAANSSPRFTFLPAGYGCVGQPLSLSLSAQDEDADELRYKLVTPYGGFDPAGRGPISATWAPGYSATNPIAGSVPVSFDSKTGTLSGTPSRLGVHLLSVEVEEWRQGVWLSTVRRDFILPVIDCFVPIPPVPIVRYRNLPASKLVLCPNTSPELSTDANGRYVHQWMKDGKVIAGAASNRLVVTSPGSYSVKRWYTGDCTRDTISESVAVLPLEAVRLSAQTAPPYCTGDTVKLAGQVPADYTAVWSIGNQRLSMPVNNTIDAVRSGWYYLRASPPLASCQSTDSVLITLSSRPTATLTASAPGLCTGDSLQLSATDSVGFQYAWSPAGSHASGSKITVRKGGTYKVTVTNQAGCKTEATPIQIAEFPSPTIEFDSIRPACVYDTSIALMARPAGGIFSGANVQGTTFVSKGLKPGDYPVMYTYTSPEGCTNTQKRQVAVREAPTVQLPDTFTVLRGNTVALPLTATGQNTYVWTPQTFLIAGQQSAAPTCRPDSSLYYSVTATNAAGCSAVAGTYVNVLSGLYIPNAFTPNGDGQNDRWELINIESFPNSTVSIYDRWGEIIYYSKGYRVPWDGLYKEKPVPSGTYIYTIAISEWKHVYTGNVLVLH